MACPVARPRYGITAPVAANPKAALSLNLRASEGLPRRAPLWGN